MFTKSTIITGAKFVKPHIFPKARSSSPVATSTGEHYANVQEMIRRISINNPKHESEEKTDHSAPPATDIPAPALNTSIESFTDEEEEKDKDSVIPVAKVNLLLQNDCEALEPAGQMKFHDTILSSSLLYLRDVNFSIASSILLPLNQARQLSLIKWNRNRFPSRHLIMARRYHPGVHHRIRKGTSNLNWEIGILCDRLSQRIASWVIVVFRRIRI